MENWGSGFSPRRVSVPVLVREGLNYPSLTTKQEALLAQAHLAGFGLPQPFPFHSLPFPHPLLPPVSSAGSHLLHSPSLLSAFSQNLHKSKLWWIYICQSLVKTFKFVLVEEKTHLFLGLLLRKLKFSKPTKKFRKKKFFLDIFNGIGQTIIQSWIDQYCLYFDIYFFLKDKNLLQPNLTKHLPIRVLFLRQVFDQFQICFLKKLFNLIRKKNIKFW